MDVKIRVLWSALLTALLVPSSTLAQLLRVSVREEGTERQVAGAVVSLVTHGDTALLARFTNESGVATLPAPAGGQYRVTVRRIGYRPGRTNVTVGQAGMSEITLRLTPNPAMVAIVIVEGDSSCGDINAEGDDVFRLWENVRSVLEANRLTESQRLVRMEIETYDRDLDRQLLERSRRIGRKVTATRQPFSAASPADLESRGYVITTNGETFYFAPDASTLLSDEFARSHCFFVTRGFGAERNLVGLAFRPKPDVSKPNVAGTLWLEDRTFALRHMAFRYVNVNSPIPLEGVGGRLEFEPVPGGAWIVPRWYIRTPRFGLVTRYISELSRMQAIDTLLGVRETGGTARVLGEHEIPAGNASEVTTPESHVGQATVSADNSASCSNSTSLPGKITIFGSVTDARGNAVPQAKLVLSWVLPELANVGTSVLAGSRGQSIEVEPDDRGNYAVCGLPAGVDYRVKVTVAGRHVGNKDIPAERSARRVEVRFTLKPSR